MPHARHTIEGSFLAAKAMRWAAVRLHGFHRNESGTISVISVFGLMLLAMLLGMVINVGKQVDDKVRLQNAADAGTYSGSVVIARGMNTLAFSNHLLCDVFALTAYMREARDQMARPHVPEILAAWQEAADAFAGSNFGKFRALARGIEQKLPYEQRMVDTFNEWAAASSQLTLPMLEMILERELIPEFQRAIVQTTPHMAQLAMDEVVQEHGFRNATASSSRRYYRGVLWRTNAMPVDNPEAEAERRLLPVIDPVLDTIPEQEDYRMKSLEQRRKQAFRYLSEWNDVTLRAFDSEAKMSQFADLWRGYSRGQLDALLDEYPNANLLHMIREHEDSFLQNAGLQRDYMFVGVAYAEQVPQILPGLFRHPTQSSALCFTQVMLFVPQRRLIWIYRNQQGDSVENFGEVPGDIIEFDARQYPQPPSDDEEPERRVGRENTPTQWNLLNQNWTIQLMPARATRLPDILQSQPQVPGFPGDWIRPPEFPGITADDLRRVNTH